MGLFGEPEPVSIQDAINYAVSVINDNYGDHATISMFDSANDSFTLIDKYAHQAATSPYNRTLLPDQESLIAGDYSKGNVQIGELNIAIENPADSVRSGTDPNGKEWKIAMQHHYGYIKNTTGADGDEIDVFVKNHLDSDPEHAYIIRQLNSDGSFDEHKIIIGAETEDEAKEIYHSNFEAGWQGFGSIERIAMADLPAKFQHTWSEFDSWAADGSYEHIPLKLIVTDKALKVDESKINKEDPVLVIEKGHKYYLVVGQERLNLAIQRNENLVPAIIFDDKDVKNKIIQKALRKAGSTVDTVALAALIVDEMEKSLISSFDSASNPLFEILYQSS